MANIYYPSLVEQQGQDPNIPWVATPSVREGGIIGQRWQTAQPIRHISNPASGNLRDQTYSLIITGFRIPDLGTINGISLRVLGQRNGRIADETISLYYQGSAIGNNNFRYETDDEGRLPLSNETIYGNSTDLWGTNLTAQEIQDPSFGVILRFQAHPYYPHSTPMLLESVSLTVY